MGFWCNKQHSQIEVINVNVKVVMQELSLNGFHSSMGGVSNHLQITYTDYRLNLTVCWVIVLILIIWFSALLPISAPFWISSFLECVFINNCPFSNKCPHSTKCPCFNIIILQAVPSENVSLEVHLPKLLTILQTVVFLKYYVHVNA